MGECSLHPFHWFLKSFNLSLSCFFQNSGIDSDSTQARFVECLFVCISSSLRYLLGASRGCSGRWCWCVRVPADWCCQGRGEIFRVSISTYIETTSEWPWNDTKQKLSLKRLGFCNWKWWSLIWKFANRRWIGLPCCWHKRWAKSWSLHLPWRSRVNNWGRFRLTCDSYDSGESKWTQLLMQHIAHSWLIASASSVTFPKRQVSDSNINFENSTEWNWFRLFIRILKRWDGLFRLGGFLPGGSWVCP